MSLHRSAAFLCSVMAPGIALAVGTSFTYHGCLTHTGAPVSGTYDLEFKLYGAASGGPQVGSTIVSEDVSVTAGVFTVLLDFGGVFDGSERWLEIGVRPGSDTGAFETLSPRQHLTAVPYALQAASASSAASLDCLACVAESELTFDPPPRPSWPPIRARPTTMRVTRASWPTTASPGPRASRAT